MLSARFKRSLRADCRMEPLEERRLMDAEPTVWIQHYQYLGDERSEAPGVLSVFRDGPLTGSLTFRRGC